MLPFSEGCQHYTAGWGTGVELFHQGRHISFHARFSDHTSNISLFTRRTIVPRRALPRILFSSLFTSSSF